MFSTKWIGPALDAITKKLTGYDDSIAFLTRTIKEQNETIAKLQARADDAAYERNQLDKYFRASIADVRAKIKDEADCNLAAFVRITNQDSLIKTQDEAISSIDSMFKSQTIKLGELRTDMESRTEQLSDEAKAYEEKSTRRDQVRARALNEYHDALAKLTQRVADIHTVLNIVIREAKDDRNKLDGRTESLAEDHQVMRDELDATNQKLADLIASMQYATGPAEFVKYVHAPDLTELCRKLVRTELDSFDFAPRVDEHVKSAAIRALVNLTGERRQSGSIMVAGSNEGAGMTVHAGSNGGTRHEQSFDQGSQPKNRPVNVQRDSDNKPIYFTADGKGYKPE
jgi:hypothetical protein